LRAEKSCLFDEVIFTQDFHPENHISFASTHGLAPFAHLNGKGSLPIMCIKPTSGNMDDASCCPTYYLNASTLDCDTQLCPPDDFSYDTDRPAFVSSNPACSRCASNPEECFSTVQEMWTDHCLQTGDATFPPSLDKRSGDFVVQKGQNVYVDAYSAFLDNTDNLKTDLDMHLQARSIDTLYVVGIATDFCVKFTVEDALGMKTSNYQVNLIYDATAAVQGDAANYNASIYFMQDRGATLYTTADVLAMSCPPEARGDQRRGADACAPG